MMKILFSEGVPVPEICETKDGNDFYEKDGRMYLLTTKLRGHNIVCLEQLEESYFFSFGQIIAKLHLAFRECEKTMSFWDNSLLEEMEGWVTNILDENKRDYLSKSEITQTIAQLVKVYENLPKQLIHRDVHLGNFLFDEGKFSGYIDFDLSQRNIRIFDLCYFLFSLLQQKNQQPEIEEIWFKMTNQVVRGYDAFIPLTKEEKESIAVVMKSIELLFTAYFLSVGNEKSAKDSADLFLFISKNEKKIRGDNHEEHKNYNS